MSLGELPGEPADNSIVYQSGVRVIESHIERVEHRRREVRTKEGVDAFNNSTEAERARIVQSFRDAKGTLQERRKAYVRDAEEVLESHEQIRKEVHSITSPPSEVTKSIGDSEEKKADVVTQDKHDWDAVFEKDLELAMKISLQDTSMPAAL